MSDDLLRYLAGKLNDEIKVLTEDLARGTAKDHGEYKYVCGIVRGLMLANGVMEETSRNLENDDD